MSEKFTTQNKAGLWNNDNKQEPWQDDYRSKIYISEPGWHWIGAVEKGGEGKPAMQVEVRKMTQEMVQKYCHDIKVLTKEQAKEKYGKGDSGASRSRGDSEIDNDIPF